MSYEIAEEEYFEKWEMVESIALDTVSNLDQIHDVLEEFNHPLAEEILRVMNELELLEVPNVGSFMKYEYVVSEFEENVKPHVVAEYGDNDYIAMREAFNNYTDYLCKSNDITEWQYDNMDNPY